MVPGRSGNRGLSETAGVVVIGCGFPLGSVAWNSTVTTQLTGLGSLMSTRQRLPCRSPAYSVVTAALRTPILLVTVTLGRPFGCELLHAVGTAAHRLIGVPGSEAPVCGSSAYRYGVCDWLL